MKKWSILLLHLFLYFDLSCSLFITQNSTPRFFLISSLSSDNILFHFPQTLYPWWRISFSSVSYSPLPSPFLILPFPPFPFFNLLITEAVSVLTGRDGATEKPFLSNLPSKPLDSDLFFCQWKYFIVPKTLKYPQKKKWDKKGTKNRKEE